MLTGGCHCGYVRYSGSGPALQETNCHCSICRRTAGAAFVSWFTVRRSEFSLVHGTPSRYASSGQAERSFCPRCGTQLTFEHVDFPDEIDVSICSLDDSERVPPKDHTWTSSKLRWVQPADRLPEFPQARE
jgi:hypothetical protein